MGDMKKTLAGENSFLVKDALNRIVNDYITTNGDLGLEQIDGEEAPLQRIAEALTGIGLLADKKLVIVRGLTKNKEAATKLDDLLGQVPDTTDAIFVEHKIDKRSVAYKVLKSKTDYQEFNKLDDRGLVRWVGQAVKDRGGKIALADAEYLVARVGINQLTLSNEIDKLLVYDKTLNRKNIELLTEPTPQSTVFQLLESAFGGNTRQTIRLYQEQREQNVEPHEIIAMITWQLGVLAIVIAAGGKSDSEIAKVAKLHPYTLGKTRAISRRLDGRRLKQLVHGLLDIDLASKSRNIDLDAALQKYLIELCA